MNKTDSLKKNQDVTLLFEAIFSLDSIEEYRRFFRDLMTEQEIETFASRFKAAVMLSNGVPYRDIAKQTGMSTATITRINNWLERGMDGYTTAIKNLVNAKKLFLNHPPHSHKS